MAGSVRRFAATRWRRPVRWGARRRIDELDGFFGICCTIVDLAPSREFARWCGARPCDTATGTVACVPEDNLHQDLLAGLDPRQWGLPGAQGTQRASRDTATPSPPNRRH